MAGDMEGSPVDPSKLPPPIGDTELRELVLKTFGNNRWTQDSPIVPEVWFAYLRAADDRARARVTGAEDPKNPRPPCGDALSLILTPWTGVFAGAMAGDIREGLAPGWTEDVDRSGGAPFPLDGRAKLRAARIAASTSRVVADLDLGSLVRIVLPLTGWWYDLWRGSDLDRGFTRFLSGIEGGGVGRPIDPQDAEWARFVILVGFIRMLQTVREPSDYQSARALLEDLRKPRPPASRGGTATADVNENQRLYDAFLAVFGNAAGCDLSPAEAMAAARLRIEKEAEDAKKSSPNRRDRRKVWLVTLNRRVERAVSTSHKTVKADAGRRLFEIDASDIHFAVVDDGIDACHRAFQIATKDGGEPPADRAGRLTNTRVYDTYDFSNVRMILSEVGLDPNFDFGRLNCDLGSMKTGAPPDRDLADRMLGRIRRRLLDARNIDWEQMSTMIRISHTPERYRRPAGEHGTHVAGIMAADFPGDRSREVDPVLGVCPDMGLWDLRVFDPDGVGDEFSVLCALEFIGWINRKRDQPVIHGVNLSLALVHDVESFACGKTPVCDACDRLVGSGVVVVAAAGNTGFEGDHRSMGTGYRSISITDPGNAAEVITVGSTHRRDPHAYGVSYFSARGPTGDGRLKPDILAPGEKIVSTVLDDGIKRMDGTSMAAPHVAAAAAMLMARYPELVGDPWRIKQILMATATDLRRERYFQGSGLVDVLRALQSI